jgi:hypothetical protein
VSNYNSEPECTAYTDTDPYPYAIDEAFDVYQALMESVGKIIGLSGRKLNIIMSGDSA